MFGFESSVIAEYWPLFVHGAWTTVQVTIICVCLGMCLGTLLGMGRLAQARYNPLKGFLHYCVRWPITVYVSFFRGTPLFVQIFLMYFAVLPVFIHPVDGLLISGQLARDIRSNYGAMLAGVCAITLNSGAYMCEIFRAGIQSLDKGQMEAARSLGMSYMQAMRTIILPQAFRRMLPEGFLAHRRHQPGRTRLRCPYCRGRFGPLLGTLHHHFLCVLGDDAAPRLGHPQT